MTYKMRRMQQFSQYLNKILIFPLFCPLAIFDETAEQQNFCPSSLAFTKKIDTSGLKFLGTKGKNCFSILYMRFPPPSFSSSLFPQAAAAAEAADIENIVWSPEKEKKCIWETRGEDAKAAKKEICRLQISTFQYLSFSLSFQSLSPLQSERFRASADHRFFSSQKTKYACKREMRVRACVLASRIWRAKKEKKTSSMAWIFSIDWGVIRFFFLHE